MTANQERIDRKMPEEIKTVEDIETSLQRGFHYPIRCVCCYQEVVPGEALFRLSDRTQTAADRRRAIMGYKQSMASDEGDFPDAAGDEGDFPEKQKTTENPNSKSVKDEFLTAAQLAERYDVVSFKTTKVDPARSGLQQGSIPDAIICREGSGDEMHEFMFSNRYCPFCRNPLPALAGQLPTYIVTLLGPSNAGKTVYLCALFRALTRSSSGVRLPCGGGLSGSADMSYNAVEELSNRMYAGYLPDTTVDAFSKPMVFELTYDNPARSTSRKCLLAVSDMKGETFHNPDSLDTHAALLDMYLHTDGFLFFVDPDTLPRVQTELNLPRDGGNTIAAMRAIITRGILAHYDGNVVRKPTVVFMTKVDMLLNRMRQIMIRLPETNDRSPSSSHNRDYYRCINEETRNLIRLLSTDLFSFLNASFPESFFTSVSALGVTPHLDASNRAIEAIELRNSIRLVQPVIVLLSLLQILPPYLNWEKVPAENPDLPKKAKKRQEQEIGNAIAANTRLYEEWKLQNG